MPLRRLHQDTALRQNAIVHIKRHREKKVEHEVISRGMTSIPPFLISNNQALYGTKQVKEAALYFVGETCKRMVYCIPNNAREGRRNCKATRLM